MTDPLHLTALAWLLTYALHSTLLLGGAWLVTRRLRSARACEVLWRIALVGGLFSATAQLLSSDVHSGARWVLDPGARTAVEAPAALAGGAPAARAPLEWADPGQEAAPRAGARGSAPWTEWALFGWALSGVALLTLLLVGGRRLAASLAGRRAVQAGVLPEVLAALRAGARLRRRVRLTVAPGLRAPVALGVLRPEICIPPRALGLSRPLARTMLAHELAHLARLDPLWLAWARLMETLFFFQPLNRLARRRLGEAAEFQCDAWAVRQTGDRLGLARCLAEVAGWLVGTRPPRPACAMADLRSPLGARIERILDERPATEHAPSWLAPAGALLLGATALLAPGFAAPSTSSLPGLPPPALEPAADPLDPFGLAWEALRLELDLLDAQLEDLRRLAARRELSPETLQRLDTALRLAAELRVREGTIGTLLAAWQARAHTTPMDAR